MSAKHSHTFVVYVENKPGVLNRIASLFRRRAYNIESLTVGHTERPGVSRMTIVSAISEGRGAPRRSQYLQAGERAVGRGRHRRLHRRAQPGADQGARPREDSRHRLMEIVRVFRARVVDLAPQSLIIEITGAEDKIHALVEVLRPFGILEMVRTGQVVMTRGVQRARRSDASPEARHQQPGKSPKRRQAQRAGRRLRIRSSRYAFDTKNYQGANDGHHSS